MGFSSLVDSFLANETFGVRFNKKSYNDIKELFIEINGQDISEFPEEVRVYYGKAWFNKKENGYSIVFDNTLTSADITKRPSTYMPLEQLVESGFKVSELEKLADNYPKTVFLLCSKPYVNQKTYINFNFEGLVEVRFD